MNNLVLTKKRHKSRKTTQSSHAIFKKGVFTSYKPSVLEEKQKQAREEYAATDS